MAARALTWPLGRARTRGSDRLLRAPVALRRPGAAAVDAQFDDAGNVPFQREHHASAGTVDVDLLEVLEQRPGRHIQDDGELVVRARRGDDRLAVLDQRLTGRYVVSRLRTW